ncbi:MAG: DNA gyrase subunit A [Alphaproteobacteria bacterium]|nr:DNA gyrase subunit A [Alphaproteobacteria bacterium]
MTTNLASRDIKSVAIEEEMKKSYLDYAMSVIVSRALPDVRDGLKPVHRRILYAMKEAGNDYNRPYRKSARPVADVMGKYHPHGDSPIYDAMVRMAQPFSMRDMLVDGQGNFGSVDGDPPAAMRYTEARLTKQAHFLLDDIDKETVEFQPNYDESLTEPMVLPARFPNILINGANGIAVGMATSIPTHNLGEIIDACCALVDNPELGLEDLIRYVPGPDFPTGSLILGRKGIHDAYSTGRGSIVMRGKSTIESYKDNREAIVITEIPYQVNKARLVERIADLVKEKVVEGVSDLRDESNREGMRIVIELKKDVVAEVILNLLYKHTPLQSNFSANMLALHHGRPETMNLKQMLAAFLEFREEVIYRRTRYELRQARDKAHLFLGLALAVANIDLIISLIRKAPDRQTAKEQLMATPWDASSVRGFIKLVDYKDLEGDAPVYHLSETQANGILDLRLHRLTNLERDKIAQELENLIKDIEELLSILGSRAKLLGIMKDELVQIKEMFATPRRSEIVDFDGDVDFEDLIQREDMVVTVSMGGYIKRVPLATYRAQKRGGKGRSAMTTKDEDSVRDVFVASTHSLVLFFSTTGKVYQLKVYKLPLGNPTAKGRPMVNLLPLGQNETISTILVLPEVEDTTNTFMMFVTSKGGVRRNRVSDFTRINASGKIAIKLDPDESLIGVHICKDDQEVMLYTKQGKAIRFDVNDVRIFAGRDSNGVRGIRLAKDDVVMAMTIVTGQEDVSIAERVAYLKHASKLRQSEDGQDDAAASSDDEDDNNNDDAVENVILTAERIAELAAREEFILTLTEKGFGKRTSAYEYRTINRGGSGIRNILVTAKNGPVVASFPVLADDDIMLVTDQGQLIRCPVHDIRMTGRNAQGVIVFRISADEKVVAVSRVPAEEEGTIDDNVAESEEN